MWAFVLATAFAEEKTMEQVDVLEPRAMVANGTIPIQRSEVRAVQVKRTVVEGQWWFEMQSVGVGHSFPTGDLFRNLTLEVDRDGWTVVHRIGREFSVTVDPETGEMGKRLVRDTSLKPGVPQRIQTPPGERWQVRFHYGSEFDEKRATLQEDELYVVIAQGT